ncbi:MAG: ATP-binding protein [Halothiobacillaceae bacterium]
MRLPVNIFLWTLTATLLPVLALVWGVTNYSQQRFQEEVDREAHDNVSAIVVELENRLRYEQEVLTGIARAPATQSMLQALNASAQGFRHPEMTALRIRLNAFLAELQRSIPGLGSLRVMDSGGNTVAKTTLGRVSPPIFDSLGTISYVEEELDDRTLVDLLDALPADEVSYLLLPPSRWELSVGQLPTMYYAVLPLEDSAEKRVGHVVLNTFGEFLDRILMLTPKTRGGTMLIAEHGSLASEREGLVLYDDRGGQQFAAPLAPGARQYAQQIDDGRFWTHVQRNSNGIYQTDDGQYRIYYQLYHPYPNSLTGWVVALRLPAQTVSAPYTDIRNSLYVYTLVALLISLLLAGLGARYFSRPIVRLGEALKTYADGRRAFRLQSRSQTHELRELERAFDYMAQRLDDEERRRQSAERRALQQAKLASVGEMAAGIGHEINNPLNNVLSLTRLIDRQLPEDGDALRQDVQALREEALRVSQIVRGVMNFARQLPPAHETVRLGDWLTAILERLQPEAMEADVWLEAEPYDPDCTIEADPGQIEQVLTNLIRNALQATAPEGRVVVRARCSESTLDCVVIDEGGGIAEENLKRIYDPFFTTKDVNGGTGLGLSISLGIVHYHGGTLEVMNRSDGKGTVARLALPRRRSPPRFN